MKSQLILINSFYKANEERLVGLAQNPLMQESHFIKFARERGVPVSGVTGGDPGKFYKLGLLENDYWVPENNTLYFHPFRVYCLHMILKDCHIPITPSAFLRREKLKDLFVNVLSRIPDVDVIKNKATEWNLIIKLAIIFEPIYWPNIIGQQTYYNSLNEEQMHSLLDIYRQDVDALVKSLDSKYWEGIHKRMRIDAANIDDNDALYLLLRVSKWSQRKELKGNVSLALLVRHIAESIRLAFHDSCGEVWDEEDRAFGVWSEGGRENLYGSERLLDNPIKSIPKLVNHFGLFSGSMVRWYVEGDTEYYAILEIIPNPTISGIELVNLRGNISTEKGNIAMKLSDALLQDISLRRFSMITFDNDVKANVRTIKQYLMKNPFVGLIFAHSPDFEFANFTVEELKEIAMNMDKVKGFAVADLEQGDYSHISSGREFEEQYKKLSQSKRCLKGKDWGKALASYALEYPDFNESSNTQRPVINQIGAALRARHSNYDYSKNNFSTDPNTLKYVKKT